MENAYYIDSKIRLIQAKVVVDFNSENIQWTPQKFRLLSQALLCYKQNDVVENKKAFLMSLLAFSNLESRKTTVFTNCQ